MIKPVAVFALICGAPLLQAQVLGGGAGGGLGGSLGGTLGGGMGSIGGMGQGSANGALGGSLDHSDTLRRHATGALDRTRETTGRVRDRVATHARYGAGRRLVRGVVDERRHRRSQWRRERRANGIAGSATPRASRKSASLSGVTGAANGNAAGDLAGSLDSVKDAAPSAGAPCRRQLPDTAVLPA